MKFATPSNAIALKYVLVAGFLAPSLPQAGDDGQLAEGARVFDSIAGVGCKTCHGEYGEGDVGVGPYIRGATEGTIRAAIDATAEMIAVKSVITDEEIRAVAAYVGNLGTKQAVRTLVKRGRFLPEEASVQPGTDVQLIIQNSSIRPSTFKSDNMNIDDLTIAGRSSGAVEWRAPGTEGEFSLYCTDCKLKGQFFTVHIDAGAEKFHRVMPVNITTESTM